jgi:hypothetical protein
MPWMVCRARILHGISQVIAKDRADGMRAGPAYRKARGRWNRSVLARKQGRRLSESGIRALYSTWKKNPTAEAFAPQWKSPSRKKITPRQAVELARRAIVSRISVSELFCRLKAESPRLNFSRRTLYRAVPSVSAIDAVWRAGQALEKAERVAMRALRLEGAAA